MIIRLCFARAIVYGDHMTNVDFIATDFPLPTTVTLVDPEINNGEPFEYRSDVHDYRYGFNAQLLEEVDNSLEFDALANLPLILPKNIYILEGLGTAYYKQYDSEEKVEKVRLELKKFRAFVRHVVNTLGEVCVVFQSLSAKLLCAENIDSITMCVDDLDLDGDSFNLGRITLHRFVRREEAPVPIIHGNVNRKYRAHCITLLACPQRLPAGYAKEHGIYQGSWYGQHELDLSKEHLGLPEGFEYYAKGLSDLDKILPPHIYLAGNNPSIYPWGDPTSKHYQRKAAETLVNYLQSIVDEQGEVWYIRHWMPDSLAKADTVEIRTMKISDLDLSGEIFEFELGVLYHFVKEAY